MSTHYVTDSPDEKKLALRQRLAEQMAAYEASGGLVSVHRAGASTEITRHYDQKTKEHWLITQDRKEGRKAKRDATRGKQNEVRD